MSMPSSRKRTVAVVAALALVAPVAIGAAAYGAPAAKPKNTPAYSIGAGSNPAAIAVSQPLGKAFVANDGSVSVISLLTHRELAEVNSGGGEGQNGITLVRGNTKAYITNLTSTKVNIFDTETYKVTGSIPVGTGAVALTTVKPKFGERAYVAMLASKRVAVVNTATNKVTRYVKTPHGAETLTPTPDAKAVWAGSSYSGRIYVISTTNPKVRKTIAVTKAGPVQSIVFSNNGQTAWVSGLGGVAQVNVATGKVQKFVGILKIFPGTKGPNMGPIALNKSGTQLLVVNSTFPENPALGTVRLMSTTTYKVRPAITTGEEPISLAVDTVRSTAYTTNYADDTVSYFSIPK